MLLEPSIPRSELVSIDASPLPLVSARGTAIGGLLEFWHHNAADGLIPRKADFLPEHHAAVLGFINILEVRDRPFEFVFRLMGSRIAKALGVDLTGQSVAKVQPVELSRILHAHLCEATELAAPTLYCVKARREERPVHYLRIILPLSRTGATIDYLLTGSVCGGETTRQAERLM